MAGERPDWGENLTTLKSRPRSAVREVSSEDGEVDEVDEDSDDDGWETESDDDS